jgi:Response regulator containing CheY-like receiver domain and AraC-type DNA-binding domain
MLNEILKVMLVDDEFLIRDLLKKRIDWDEIGMAIAGEAANPREALELVDEIMPDIIIADICMPFMDGIEFSRLVIEKHPHIRVVILTGYDEFEYAKRSFKAGISDFILKPINKEEITKAIIKLKEKIIAERIHEEEHNRLRKQLEENLPYLREKLFNELLRGDFISDEIMTKLSYFKIEVNHDMNNYQIILIEVVKTDSEEGQILIELQCIELVRDYFKDNKLVNVFLDNSRKIVVLCNDSGIDVPGCCETIQSMINNHLKYPVCIGIGSQSCGLENIKISYKEAGEALNYKVVAGNNQVIHYSDITFTNVSEWHFQFNHYEKLNFYVKAGLIEKAEGLMDELFEGFSYFPGNHLDKVKLAANDILSACMHALTELGIQTSDMIGSEVYPYEFIVKMDTLPEIKDFLKCWILNAVTKVKNVKAKKTNTIIEHIKEHIHQNLQEPDLSMSNIAKHFYLSPSHLSRLFKQETTETFVEYLTRVRMEKAIELLKNTDMKVYQICEKVGITDPHYFSIVFKKSTGMSVNDFKKNA